MTQVTESGGRQNIYSIEPRPQVDPNYVGYPEVPRKLMVDGQCLALLLYLVLMQQQVRLFQVYSNDKIKSTGKTEDPCRKMERKTSNDRSCCSCNI